MSKRWIDITVPMDALGLCAWPGDVPFIHSVLSEADADNTDACTLSLYAFSSHFGTHVDAQKHYLPKGKSVAEIPLEHLMGPAYVLDLRTEPADFTREVFERTLPKGVQRLLLRTKSEAFYLDGKFHEDYPAITESGFQYLLEQNIFLLGIDYMSASSMINVGNLHRRYLAVDGNILLENITLKAAEQGWYDLLCLPMAVNGGDGAPARTLIRKRED